MAGEFISVNGTSCQNLAWLNPDGTLDSTSQVNGPIESMALQTDGALLIAGDFTSVSGQPRNKIARLGPGGSTFFPFIDNAVSGLALEPNGQLLIAGFFSKVAGQPRSGFARLLNSEPGFQALSVDGSTIYWRRGGTAPEITYASFEASQDGTNWLSLGFGTRTNSGFFIKLNDSNLNSAIRARGAVTGGQNNASSWFVESTLPAIRPLGFISGQFALNVIGSAGQTFVLETSTDLRNWSPLQTNTANSATIFFTDTDSTHNATRFYRAHKQVPD